MLINLSMEINKTLYITKRQELRKWLAKNYKKEKEIWLIYYKKASGKPRIPYNDAVEEALCYGWIDSTVKRIDEERFAQRFTPRRSNSVLSEMNKERIRRLIKTGKMKPQGLKAISHVFKHDEKFSIPKDIIKALKEGEAWENFQKFPEYYQRIRIGYVQNQGKHNKEMFKKALNYLVKMTAKNKRFGMVK